jgi:Zn-dependent protease
VLLDEQRETPFDLRFRLFGTHVRVHPFFWLVTAFINFDLIQHGIHVLLTWIVCVFFSILLHEFGHVWMGQFFGSRGHIVMQGMCGLAVGASSVPGRWQRIAVYLAGPAIQLLLFAILITTLTLQMGGVRWEHVPDLIDNIYGWLHVVSFQKGFPELLSWALYFMLLINLYWPIINLLPIWPLDGGQVSRELFVWASPTYGKRNSLALSLAVALLVTANAISGAMRGPTIPYMPSGGRFFIFFFAIFAVESFILITMENARVRSGWRDPDDDRLPWERDPDEWKRG